jgi:CRISPR/Cas system CSM-associated protein Csm2 small subunit
MLRSDQLLTILAQVGIEAYKTEIEELTERLIKENDRLIKVLEAILKEVRDDDHHKTATR